MKKFLLATLIFTIFTNSNLLSFANDFKENQNYNKNAFEVNLLSLDFDSKHISLKDNLEVKPTNTSNIDCSGKQTSYSIGGGALGGVAGLALTYAVGLGLAFAGGRNGEAIGYMTVIVAPIGGLAGLIFGAVKGNEISINECNQITNKK